MNTAASAEKKKFKLNRTTRMYIFIAELIIIPVINFIIFWVYVNFDTILLTFKRFDVPTASYVWRGLSR